MRIKEYTSPISGKVLMLVDDEGMPLHFANRYAYKTIEKRGGSLSSVEQALFAISRLYLWAQLHKLNLENILFYGELLTSDQMSDLIDFVQFTSSTQREILKTKQREPANPVSSRSNIVSFRTVSEIKYQYTSNKTYANRLRAIQRFLKWVVIERQAQRIDTPILAVENLSAAMTKINQNIPRAE